MLFCFVRMRQVFPFLIDVEQPLGHAGTTHRLTFLVHEICLKSRPQRLYNHHQLKVRRLRKVQGSNLPIVQLFSNLLGKKIEKLVIAVFTFENCLNKYAKPRLKFA